VDPRDAASSVSQAAPKRERTLLRLAQSDSVEIYVDEDGRRVVLDAFTTGVLGLDRPGQNRENHHDRPDELNGDHGGFWLEKPEAPVATLPEAPAEAYPDTPVPTSPEEPQPRIVTLEPIEQQPLDDIVTQPAADAPAPIDGPNESAASSSGRAEVASLQVLLDRKGASPGVIDGHFGSNVDKALAAYRDITGEDLRSTDTERIDAALASSGGGAFAKYIITPEDAAGPYVASVPADYGQKAKLERLSFTSVSEALAERFHMDEGFLKALNPGAAFNRPGTVIKVVNFGSNATTPVTRIVADKGKKQVRAYDEAGKLVVAYPATIGSSDTPSPTGTHEVARIVFNPEYTYNPDVNFKQGDNDQVLTIPPGPNGPVGSVWIGLSKPSYGIHGTPDPSKIGKTGSHGCVRLTNWDAAELAKLSKRGVTVQFVE
jgi:lipoprotein-anchoring transpeptidase ErfK/SrfK